MCHFRCPWNGMFDCHRAEITVMQFTGHSLPVHQSMTVPWDFTLSHIVSQAHLRQWNMQLPHLWNGMSGRVEGQYTTNWCLDVLRKEAEPIESVCAASMGELDLSPIRLIHQSCGHPGVKRTHYFVKLVSPEVSKAAVREVVRECEEC